MYNSKNTIQTCAEYIVGCCPFEEFFVGDITKKCLKIHNKEFKRSFSENSEIYQKHLEEALYTYEMIISDVEHKKEENKTVIQPKVDDNILVCLNKVEMAISNSSDSLNSSNSTNKNYNLLKIYGDLLSMAENNITISPFEVCSNCGVFKTKQKECEHKFCKSYKKIRNILLELKNLKNKGKKL